MSRFSSYGPVDPDIHYFAPRKELIDRAYARLIGKNPGKGGHYITVWAPGQTGKTSLMIQLSLRLQNNPEFHFVHIPLEHLKLGNFRGQSRRVKKRRDFISGCL